MKIIIEHLDVEVYPWSMLEYSEISACVGKDNLIFTRVKKDKEKLEQLGKVFSESVKEKDFDRKRICILDPKAKELLKPEDGELFDYFLFGGVLGNHPMDGRTERELSLEMKECPRRHLGLRQMSTDTAVHVVKKIVDEKTPFSELTFADDLNIVLEEGFATELPYRYLIESDRVLLPKGLVAFLRKEAEESEF